MLPIPSERLGDVLSIYWTKARYFRFLDTKQWASWRELFTNDLVFYEDAGSPVPRLTEPTAVSADSFVEMVSEILRTTVTAHHGHMPEIDFVSDDEARVVWAMFDYVDDPDNRNPAYHGYGHYHETYRRCDHDTWRICELRLTRLRIDERPPTRPGWIRPWPEPWKRGTTTEGDRT